MSLGKMFWSLGLLSIYCAATAEAAELQNRQLELNFPTPRPPIEGGGPGGWFTFTFPPIPTNIDITR